MRKTLIFHIGVHKTGTTSIQRFLARHQMTLRRHGILYPASGRPASLPDGHHELPWSLMGSHGMPDFNCWSRLVAEASASECPVILLSSEGFCMLRQRHVADLAARVGEFEVRVIMYLRNPVSYMISSYKMGIKYAQRTESFGEYVRRELHRCDFRRCHGIWSDRFGAASIALQSYEEAVGGDGLITHFSTQIGLPVDALPAGDAEFANQSPGDEVVQLVRWINRRQTASGSGFARVPLEWAKSALKYNRSVAWLAGSVARPFLRSGLYSEVELAEVERLTGGFTIPPGSGPAE